MKIHPKHRSPFVASFVQTAIAAITVLVFFIAGSDPYEQMFTWLIALGALGLIALMALTSVAVIVFFARTRRERRVWSTLIAPIIAAVALGAEVVLLLLNWDLQTMGAGGLVPYLPALLLLAVVIGFAWKRGDPPEWAESISTNEAAPAEEGVELEVEESQL